MSNRGVCRCTWIFWGDPWHHEILQSRCVQHRRKTNANLHSFLNSWYVYHHWMDILEETVNLLEYRAKYWGLFVHKAFPWVKLWRFKSFFIEIHFEKWSKIAWEYFWWEYSLRDQWEDRFTFLFICFFIVLCFIHISLQYSPI